MGNSSSKKLNRNLNQINKNVAGKTLNTKGGVVGSTKGGAVNHGVPGAETTILRNTEPTKTTESTTLVKNMNSIHLKPTIPYRAPTRSPVKPAPLKVIRHDSKLLFKLLDSQILYTSQQLDDKFNLSHDSTLFAESLKVFRIPLKSGHQGSWTVSKESK
jgi:hypothetical protein